MHVELSQIVVQAPLTGIKRIPQNIDDYGDDATVGMRLKKRKERCTFMDHDYGVYLGTYNQQYHVGTCECGSYMPSRLVSYRSLEDLKKEWLLDHSEYFIKGVC